MMISLSIPYANPAASLPLLASSADWEAWLEFKMDLETILTAAFCPSSWFSARTTLAADPAPKVLPNFHGPILFREDVWLFKDVDTSDVTDGCLECCDMTWGRVTLCFSWG
ncbi:hypothetical protein WICPIJ_000514 [Wickerhamomyces pijperi]|uniref:Uncharacterized protein n=1 Tax=Wickerhamomyces pijperi TaxID=599730 RepID=A0A9P8QGV3_WICPI|nr:hypothetical protein WICPIJ_000514 [Wickerhamomyces pijperi]